MRDRLIELIRKAKQEYHTAPIVNGIKADPDYFIADHLIANGVIVPPCKVGDMVYCITEVFETPMEAKIYSITVQESGIIMRCAVKGYYGVSYMATDFGKKFFLSREDAEKALNPESEIDMLTNLNDRM